MIHYGSPYRQLAQQSLTGTKIAPIPGIPTRYYIRSARYKRQRVKRLREKIVNLMINHEEEIRDEFRRIIKLQYDEKPGRFFMRVLKCIDGLCLESCEEILELRKTQSMKVVVNSIFSLS